MMGALAFVPEDDVRRVWRLLKPLIPDDMLQFVSYYEITWIGTSAADPLFSLDLWNFHDSTLMLLPRSTNLAEGWHHGFKSMLSCHNPTTWRFLDCLKAEQDLTDLKITRQLMQEDPESRRPKRIQYETKLQKILQRFNTYADPLDLLTAVAICFKYLYILNLRMYISVLINETAFIDGKKHVTFRHYNFMLSSD